MGSCYGLLVPIQNEYQKEFRKKKMENYLLLKNVYLSPRSSSPENFSRRPEIKKVFMYRIFLKNISFSIYQCCGILQWFSKFRADPDQAFYLNADPDPEAKLMWSGSREPNQCGSGSRSQTNVDPDPGSQINVHPDQGSQINVNACRSGSRSDFYGAKCLIYNWKIYLM